MSNEKLFLRALKKEAVNEVPFWFMRQAGRYLPEYRKLRAEAKDFLHFCYSPDMATEATLQPIRRFDMSAAIIFSDILVLPHALGMNVWFETGHGPRLTPLKNKADVDALSLQAVGDFLAPVYEAITKTRQALPSTTALIGFCGAPWTLACYAVEGSGSRDYANVRMAALRDPVFFDSLIELLTQAVIEHASRQIDAGAEVIQLFDSWAGVLSAEEFARYTLAPAKRIFAELKKRYPHVPLIGFPRGAGIGYISMAIATEVDAVSVDASLPAWWLERYLQPECVVQGNLDNLLLAENKEAMLAQAKHILQTLGRKNFIFNLGHGVVPHTPVENVQALSDLIREWK